MRIAHIAGVAGLSIAPVAMVAVASCGPNAAATVNSAATTATQTLAQAQATLNTAVTFYGISKGIAQVAVAANPSLTSQVSKATAILDPLVQAAQVALTSATADVPTLQALALQIQSQAATLQTQVAGVIKVVSNKS